MTEQYFDTHVFCCVNRRAADNPTGCCASKDAERLRNYMKNKAKAVAGNIRINNSGCLDRCEHGPVMVIYPQGIWYQYKNKEDIDEIIESHLKNGKPVERLLL
jgi:(2Fe-2S) ferredoxin